MSEQTNAELLTEAYDVLSRPIRADHESEEARGVIQRLADALEAAEKRAELADADLDVELDKNAGYREKNDQLAAVVEKVRELPRYSVPDPFMVWRAVDAEDLEHALATAPADALREHGAALIEGLADEWHADNTGTSPRAYNWLHEKARQKREEH